MGATGNMSSAITKGRIDRAYSKLAKLDEKFKALEGEYGEKLDKLCIQIRRAEKALEEHYHYADDGEGEKTASAIYILGEDSSSNLGSDGE